ncbi:hypothetical protein [Pseudoduganella umbonata]|uniref:C2H2-type domain-containing protein n=1 Tax=Pseudoduganella umbonata TaxID=864828 RepID=A0ABX5UPC5_9BURK|nr:hypothetical protein [Pseudoduganella umbonata]QCP13662.1 hypothetical protein FCL38_26920 [Pseudoduganella umbonata]
MQATDPRCGPCRTFFTAKNHIRHPGQHLRHRHFCSIGHADNNHPRIFTAANKKTGKKKAGYRPA